MNIHFWRTKDMVEVDFVITGGSKTIPFEVQYSHLKKAKISRCFQNFSSKYQPEKGYLVNLSYRDTSKT